MLEVGLSGGLRRLKAKQQGVLARADSVSRWSEVRRVFRLSALSKVTSSQGSWKSQSGEKSRDVTFLPGPQRGNYQLSPSLD
jgi:hypothetical protein